MSSDDAYAAFLEKANQDVSGGGDANVQSASSDEKRIRIQSEKQVDVPAVLRGIDEVYTSESDEGFEGVAVSWEGQGVDVESLRKALHLTADTPIEEVSEGDFDPRGQYTNVLDKVRGAGDGRVKVFRIGLDGVRSEIWILSVAGEGEGKGRRLVGVRTLSVET